MNNRGKVELFEYINEPDGEKDSCISYRYSIRHNNGRTILQQAMLISSNKGLEDPAWTASIELDDFPSMKTPADAAMKLADWLDRLAQAIRIGEYQDYQRAEFVDIPNLKSEAINKE